MEQSNEINQEEKHCQNCGAIVPHEFCPECGQRYRSERLSLKMLIVDIPVQWLSMDRGFFYTFSQQFRAPGTVARRYVNGERVKFTNPLTYYLIGAAVQLLMLFFMADYLSDNLITQLKQSPETVEQLTQAHGPDAMQKYADVYISVVNQGYTYLGFIFLCIPFAFMLRWFSKRHRQAFNNAESLVFSFYTIGHFIMITGILGFVTIPFLFAFHSPISILIYFVFCILSTRGFYTKENHSIIASLVTMILAFLLFLVALMITTSIAFRAI